jgi:integrase
MSVGGTATAVEVDRPPGAVPVVGALPAGPDGHCFYGQPVTAALRDRLVGAAVEILAARLPPSRAGLDPVRRSRRAVNEWLDWLDAFPGVSYQERWLASTAEATGGRSWAAVYAPTPAARERAARALEAVICVGAIRPTYRFLFSVWSRRLWSTWREEHDQVLFARLARIEDVTADQFADVVIGLARMSIRTGKTMPQLTCDDLLEFRTAMLAVKGEHNKVSCATLYFLGRQIGLFPEGPEEFRALRTVTARTPAELVAGYGVTSPVMAGLLTEYLAERRPALDYVSFKNMAHQLCRLFWRDIELAHPGIDTHRLTRAQIEAWKQRVTTLPDGRTRQRFTTVFLTVRCFYLDINHWANDHPERWATWATPSPITRQDVRAVSHQRRAETARMHARVRELVPQLPTLVHTVRSDRELAYETLRAGRTTLTNDQFTVGSVTFTRLGSAKRPDSVRLRDADGAVSDAVFVEHAAFWSWATVEVLRHTGIRIEELLELTHYSIRPYRQPNGDVIPLLQIAPSKTDAERVIPASPELAAVLARIITRVAGADGKIPLTIRHDEHERSWSDPLPHLFQYRLGGRPRSFNSGTLREYLRRSLTHAGMNLTSRQRLTPHDFRRLFTTDAVNNGLPIHIAAALLGHQDLNTTMSYTAIYPKEVFARYSEFIERRRADRPVDDYRPPTSGELAEFADHFGQRRIELGTCVRPYATPCIHEHACLRCPFQQLDPDQAPRLVEIRLDIKARIDTARDQRWLGDVAQLEQTLRHVDTKHAQLLQLLAEKPLPLIVAGPRT